MLHIKVNATTANLCVGFDIIGMSLSLANEFDFEPSSEFEFIDFKSEYRNSNNLVKTSYEYVFNKLNKEIIPVKIKITERIPISRGLGSSSSLIVAGVFAANHYLNKPLTTDECFNLCVEIEGHPDNVAPAIFGGFVASYDKNKYISYPVDENLNFILISPHKELETKKAREALPKSLEYSKIVNNLSRIIHIPYALKNGDLALLMDLFKDELHEPYRMPLIENSYKYKEIASSLGYPFCISGSGSTMLVITKDLDNVDKFKCFGDEVRVLKLGKEMEIYEY